MKKALKERIDHTLKICFDNPDEALKEGKAILKEGESENDYEVMGYGHYLISNALIYYGERNKVIEHAMHAVTYFQSIEEYHMFTRSKNLLGVAYSANDEKEMALQYYLEALQLAKTHRITKVRENIENNIAAEYANLEDYETALPYFEKIYKKIARKKKPQNSLFIVVAYNLTECYAKLGNYEKAFYYIEKCEEIAKEMDDEYEANMIRILKTIVLYMNGRKEEANECSDQITEYIKKNEGGVFEALADIERIALLQVEIGEYDRADFYADYLWDFSANSKYGRDIIRACRVQAKYFDTIGDVSHSVRYYRVMDREYQKVELEQQKAKLKFFKERQQIEQKVEELRSKMEHQALLNSKDALTGLLNRGAFATIMDSFISQAKEKRLSLGCIFMDVDYFKEYNDTYGHIKGDECLAKLAEVCLAQEKERDHVHFARYGGDEFFGLLLGYKDKDVEEIACAIAQDVKRLNITHSCKESSGRVTLSMGIMNSKLDEASDLISVVNHVDQILYTSKKHGKNCIYAMMPTVLGNKEEKDFRRVEY